MVLRIWTVAALILAWTAAFAQGTGNIKDIIIRGNQRVSREAVLASMRTKTGQTYVQANLDQDKIALEALGFFQAVDIRAQAVEDGWIITVDLAEWPEIKEIRVAGNAAISTEKILAAITLKPGEVFNLNASDPSRRAIRDLYQAKGYFAEVAEFGPMPESPNTLNVVIVEQTVASVSVEGNERTNDRVVHRLIKTRPGDPLNVNDWREDLRRLYATQWFETVDSRQEPVDLGKIALTAVVKETRTGTFNIGVQIDPRSSFAGFLKVSDPNFRGSGQSVGINLLQSSRGAGTSIDLDYGNPFMDSHDTAMNASIYSRVVYRFTGSGFGSSETPTDANRYSERRTGGAIGFSRPIRKNTFASIGTRIERVETSDLDTTTTNNFIQQDGSLSTLTFGLTQNRRDVDIEPAKGDWFRLNIEPGWSNITKVGGAVAGDSLLGNSSYVKSSVEYRSYYSPQPPRTNDLSEPRRVVAARVRYGQISGKTPFFEQFFAGGSDTLRGYEEDRFWGTNTLLATLEYRHPIQKAFNIIGFVDYGGAWGGYGTVGDFTQSNSVDLRLGYGLGMSFRTPLGPIRLDFGFNDEGKGRTHFLIGTSF